MRPQESTSPIRALLASGWLHRSLIGGGVLGALYTVTPITVWAIALGTVVGRAALRAVPIEERRLLGIVLAVATLARVLVLGAVFLANAPRHDDESLGSLFGDETYAFNRSMRTRDVVLGRASNLYDYFVASDEYGRNGYIALLTAVHVAVGPMPYSMRLLNIVLFFAGALLLFHAARHGFGRVPAYGGLLVLLFLPTLFVWSISLLKESLYFVATAVILISTLGVVRGTGAPQRLGAIMLFLLGLAVVHDLRPAAIPLAITGVAAGIVLTVVSRSARRFVVSVTIAAVITLVALSRPAVQQRVLSGLEAAAKVHTGHVFTVGHAYKILDEGFYASPQTPASSTLTLTPAEAARFVVRGVATFFTVPWPWQLVSTRELQYLPEQMVWYALVVFLPVGLIAGWRRDALLACLLIGYVVPTAVALALTNGNVGTLLRLRVTVIPYIVWVSTVGFCAAIERLASVGVRR